MTRASSFLPLLTTEVTKEVTKVDSQGPADLNNAIYYLFLLVKYYHCPGRGHCQNFGVEATYTSAVCVFMQVFTH